MGREVLELLMLCKKYVRTYVFEICKSTYKLRGNQLVILLLPASLYVVMEYPGKTRVSHCSP